ncbi:hypothetical protein COB72_11440 [bacterium]|nr:MAG: hypothetical protein COB72_11440 [bacterium]
MKLVPVIMMSGLVAMSSGAYGQELGSFAELEAILTDQIQSENFEGISLQGGTSIDVPNPLNSVTILQLPWNWDIQAGVTYESPTRLEMHAGFSGGDENVYLRAYDGVEIRFDVGQVAFGLNLMSFASGTAYTIELFDRNDVLIETIIRPSDAGATFFGYQAPTVGISRAVFTHPTLNFMIIDNVSFGMDFIACPADVNEDGTQNFFDVSAFLSFFNEEDDRADFNDDGQFNFFDVSGFLSAFAVACP